MTAIGKIRVGRLEYRYGSIIYEPYYEEYLPIKIMIKNDPKNGEYGAISPFNVRVPVNGYPLEVIHENYWQFLKVYEKTPPIKQYFSKYDNRIRWEYDECIQINNNNVTAEWYKWKDKGFNSQNWIRYPVGTKPEERAKCKYSLTLNDDGTVNESNKQTYISSRKVTYVTKYVENVIKYKEFLQLKKILLSGQNILIIEVDGPHQESLPYYIEKYGVNKNFIINNTVEVTVKNMKILLNDEKHAFGHGYCAAMELLEITNEVLND